MLPYALLFGIAAVLVVLVVYRSLSSPLRNIPGPFLARFTRLWYLHRVRLGDFEHTNIELHRKYGPVVRVAPNLFSISDVGTTQTIYGIASKFPKSNWYDGWKNPKSGYPTVFSERDMARHADTRKRFQRMYSMSEMVNYEGSADSCALLLARRFSEFAATGQQVDMGHWLQCYAFDVIGEITYSARFGFLDDGRDKSGLLQALHRSQVYGTLIGIYAEWHRRLWDLAVKMPWLGASSRVYLMRYVDEQVKRRNAERTTRKLDGGAKMDGRLPDFLDKLMDGHEANPDKVTPYHIFMMGLSNINAGSDTTAVSLSAVLYYLLKSPAAMAKLRDEIGDFERRGLCSRPAVSFKESQAMPYLQLVIKEALRLHSATGLPLWRVVPEGGADFSGHYFPPGAVVGLNTWVAHYDEHLFGSDAAEFRPERWIEAEDNGARLKAMNAAWMPFGLGSRTCLGRHVAMLEISKIVPQLVRDFDFEMVACDKDWKTENYWFVKPVDFNVTIKIRNTS